MDQSHELYGNNYKVHSRICVHVIHVIWSGVDMANEKGVLDERINFHSIGLAGKNVTRTKKEGKQWKFDTLCNII